MAAPRFSSEDPALDALYEDLSAACLQPLWELGGLLTPEPRVRAVPYRWRAKELAKLARRAGDLVPVSRGGDRRVLAMSNPGLGGLPFVSRHAVGRRPVPAAARVGARAPAHAGRPAVRA